MKFQELPRSYLRRIQKGPQLLYKLGLGSLVGRLVLILFTTGRISGRIHATPLQYEEIEGTIYVAAALGQKADWYRNILAHPRVRVQVGSREYYGRGEPITDPVRIADFLEVRLKRHPRMIGAMLKAEGLPVNCGREQLEDYASRLAMVKITPEETI